MNNEECVICYESNKNYPECNHTAHLECLKDMRNKNYDLGDKRLFLLKVRALDKPRYIAHLVERYSRVFPYDYVLLDFDGDRVWIDVPHPIDDFEKFLTGFIGFQTVLARYT